MIVLSIVISFAKKRFRHFVYLMPIFVAVWTLFSLAFAIDNFTVVEQKEGRAALVEIWVFALCMVNFMACLFITPSLPFLLIGYGPSLLLAQIYIIA